MAEEKKELFELRCGECDALLATSDNPAALENYLVCTPCDEATQSAAVVLALSKLPGNAKESTKLDRILEAATLSRQETIAKQKIQSTPK